MKTIEKLVGKLSKSLDVKKLHLVKSLQKYVMKKRLLITILILNCQYLHTLAISLSFFMLY